MGDDHQLDEGEKPYADEGDALADSDSDSGMSEWNAPAVAGTYDTENGNAAASGGQDTHTPSTLCGALVSALSAAAAEQLNASQILVAAGKQAIEALRTCGAVTAVQQLDNEMRRGRRRQILSATENPALAGALLEMSKQHELRWNSRRS